MKTIQTTAPIYEYSDRIMKVLIRKYIRTFESAKGKLLPADELNILDYSKRMYRELELFTERYFLMTAEKVYEDSLSFLSENGISTTGKTTTIGKKWLNTILSAYDPVTMYVYQHEVERKQARFAESVIAAINREKEIDKALRLWSNMAKQYVITVTDKAVIQAYADCAVDKVIWITNPDEKRCEKCGDMEGEVFDITEIPPKPHLYCRCWVMPYFGDD